MAIHWMLQCRLLWLFYAVQAQPRHPSPDGVTMSSTQSYSLPSAPESSAPRGAETILAAVVFGAQDFLNHADWSGVLDTWLARLGRATDADQVRIFQNDEPAADGKYRVSMSAQWKAPGIESGMPREALQKVRYGDVGCGRWPTVLARGESIVGITADFPSCERPILETQGIQSVAIVPVFVSERWWGFMGFSDCNRPRQWLEAELHALSAAAGILGAALARREMERRIGTAQAQEQLAAEIGEVLTARSLTLDESLQHCAASVVRHLKADLVRIWIMRDTGDVLAATPAAGPASAVIPVSEIRVGAYALGTIAQDGTPQIWNDGIPEIWPGSNTLAEAAGLVGGAAHPLIKDGRVVGVVVMLLHTAPTQAQLDGLASVTDELALAIEHSRAQAALHRSEDRYRRLVDATVEGIVIHDGLHVLDMNPSLAEMVGYEIDEIVGTNPFDYLDPSCHEDVRRRLAENYERPYEATMVHRDGRVFPIEIKASDFYRDGVKLRVAAIRDITERKAAERAARQLVEERGAREAAERTRRQAEFLLDASHILAASFDTSTVLNQLAHLAVRFLADFCVVSLYDEDETQIAAAVHVDPSKQSVLEGAVEMWRAHWQESHPLSMTQSTGEAFVMPVVTPHDLDNMARDDEHRRLLGELGTRSLMSAPIRSGGELIGSIMFASSHATRQYATEDLALAQELGRRAAVAIQAARSYDEAQAATRARDEMLGVVAHDLRNPLNTISMGSSLALEIVSGYPGEPARRQLEIIQRSTEHMNGLIQDLLDASRVQSGQLALEVAPTKPVTIVNEAVEMLAPLATHAGVALETDVPSDLSPIPADRQRLLQVLSNLIGNALKFTPNGGRITLTVQREEHGVRFSVSDTGTGIAPDQLPHVFTRFWQARGSDRRGLGLGLSIAKGIVEAHGGAIWAESQEGAGSTFAFSVPEAAPDLTVN
ncbi:MAG: GAF domain-containing protein [Longimicrobiales bacterium]